MAIDTYEALTDRIIATLESGVVPWRKPWKGGANAPQNRVSRRPYRGINSFILGISPYSLPYWVTFKQAKDLGGSVRKGEKGTPVIFWKFLDRPQPDGTVGKFPMARTYYVFNLEQTEGVKPLVADQEAKEPVQVDPIAACDAIVAGFQGCPQIAHGGSQAYYRPSTDTVHMPDRSSFLGSTEYYSTLFHELGHSTGHSKRLDRDTLGGVHGFGDHSYSKEELVAEFTAAFLCGEAGIAASTVENSAAYIGHWLTKLRNDKKMAIQAAGHAQRAADHILSKAEPKDQDPE